MGMITPTMAQWLEQSGVLQGKGVFVTGTDTGVGKTWVGTRLIPQFRALGREVIVRKPVETGWTDEIEKTDAWLLAQAAGVCKDPARDLSALKSVCPYRLKPALAPPRAAHLEQKRLIMRDVVSTCPVKISPQQFLWVEGAGGFCSPLSQDGLNADFAQILGLPVLVVSDDRVGSLNQVLMVAEVIKHRHLQLAGVILNPRESSTPDMDNLSDLQQLLDVPVMRLSTL